MAAEQEQRPKGRMPVQNPARPSSAVKTARSATEAAMANLGPLPVAATVRAALRCAGESEFLEICEAERERLGG